MKIWLQNIRTARLQFLATDDSYFILLARHRFGFLLNHPTSKCTAALYALCVRARVCVNVCVRARECVSNVTEIYPLSTEGGSGAMES
jgi:hypothetical protein